MGTTAPVTVVHNSALTQTGSWTTTTTVNALAGNWIQANGPTPTLSYTGYFTDVYLMPYLSAIFGIFTVAIDGVTLPDFFTCSGQTSNQIYQSLMPIARGLAYGVSHTIVFTPASGNTLQVDSLILVNAGSQALKGTPTPGSYVNCTMSWGSGYNTFNTDNTFAYVVAKRLRYAQTPSPSITLHNLFAAGQSIASPTGCIHQILSNLALQPQYLSIVYGVNDMNLESGSYVGCGEYVRICEALCCFLEDAFDLTQMKVAFATPPWLGAVQTYTKLMNGGTFLYGDTGRQLYELAVEEFVAMMNQHQKIAVADIFGPSANRNQLFFPVGTGIGGGVVDFLHGNDSMHLMLGHRISNAFLGNNEDVINTLPLYTNYYANRGGF